MSRLSTAVSHAAIIILVAATSVHISFADEIPIARFGTEGIKGWETRRFNGTTEYRLVEENGTVVLKAHARGVGSALIRKQKFNVSHYRDLRWSWKISNTIAEGDERFKKGDDYAARIYVVFPGRFFWQMRAINYIWANHLKKSSHIPSSFSSRIILVAVESGNSKAGEWVNEERDILDDYRNFFGEEPPEAGGIAIMTDTDNTGAEATAWYGDITVATKPVTMDAR